MGDRSRITSRRSRRGAGLASGDAGIGIPSAAKNDGVWNLGHVLDCESHADENLFLAEENPVLIGGIDGVDHLVLHVRPSNVSVSLVINSRGPVQASPRQCR